MSSKFSSVVSFSVALLACVVILSPALSRSETNLLRGGVTPDCNATNLRATIYVNAPGKTCTPNYTRQECHVSTVVENLTILCGADDGDVACNDPNNFCVTTFDAKDFGPNDCLAVPNPAHPDDGGPPQ